MSELGQFTRHIKIFDSDGKEIGQSDVIIHTPASFSDMQDYGDDAARLWAGNNHRDYDKENLSWDWMD